MHHQPFIHLRIEAVSIITLEGSTSKTWSTKIIHMLIGSLYNIKFDWDAHLKLEDNGKHVFHLT
jgi:hypothetical protein